VALDGITWDDMPANEGRSWTKCHVIHGKMMTNPSEILAGGLEKHCRWRLIPSKMSMGVY